MKIEDIQRLFEKKNAQVEEARAMVKQLEIEIYQLQGRYAEAQEREQNGPILRTGQGSKAVTDGGSTDPVGAGKPEEGDGVESAPAGVIDRPTNGPDNTEK